MSLKEKDLVNTIVDYIIDLEPKHEVNVFWNKIDKRLVFMDTEDKNTLDHLMRIGTIGTFDMKAAGVNVIKSKDGKKEMYELDDGIDIFNKPYAEAQLGFKPKRTFIDSSFGDKQALKDYLKAKAVAEGWYQKMLDACCDEHKKKAAGLVS